MTGRVYFYNSVKKVGAIATSNDGVYHFTGVDIEEDVKTDDAVSFVPRKHNVNVGQVNENFAEKIKKVL